MKKQIVAGQKGTRKWKRPLIWTLVLLGLGGIVFYAIGNKPKVSVALSTETIHSGSLFEEVSATGMINPIEVVDVGTQVSGIIEAVHVDYNQKVKKGEVIASMDRRNLNAAVRERDAELNKAQVTLDQAELDHQRNSVLFGKGAIPKVDHELSEVTLKNAKANLKLARLQVEKADVNLSYATIVSPIDGIVISKNVDVGQTVAASFSTPTLFRIANDLTKMKIEASVDEADIGQVEKGQKVDFTVDTYADEHFSGIVDQVQLQPIEVQNVVTYKVIILIENPESKLLPGMTATLIIKTEESPVAPNVPNASIDLNLSAEHVRILKKEGYTINALEQKNGKTIWLKDGMVLQEQPITILFDNGFRSAVDPPEIEGREVLLRVSITEGNGDDGKGSFMMPHGRPR